MENKIKGVTKSKSKKKPYRAYIGYGKTFKHLGNFLTIEEAVEARKQAEKDLPATKPMEEIIESYKRRINWLTRCVTAMQRKFNLPKSVLKVVFEPLENN